MAVSKPMQLMAFRLSEEERARLEAIAQERDVTLSDAIREGLQLLAEDARRGRDRVAAT
jgi:predicted transcriptional regulator